MTARSELTARLRELPDEVAPDQTYVVARCAPEDCQGVARLFYAVYGESYPLNLYYSPAALRQALERETLHAAVIRLENGAVAGFSALYRSTSPFAQLMEFGLGVIHPAYRGSFAFFHLVDFLMDALAALPEVEAVFGEAVCDAVIVQHVCSLFGLRETAIELDLMPEKRPGEGRTACLLFFRNLRDRRRRLYLPAGQFEALGRIVESAGLSRDVEATPAGLPAIGETRLETALFQFAGVMRANVFSLGADFETALARAEQQARAEGCRIFQLFLNAAEPAPAAAVPELARLGYGLGGLVPRWFDDDALLVQKLLDQPNAARVQLYSDAARDILAMALTRP